MIPRQHPQRDCRRMVLRLGNRDMFGHSWRRRLLMAYLTRVLPQVRGSHV